MKASDRGRNVKSKELFGCFDEIFISMNDECVGGRPWDIAIWHGYMTMHHWKLAWLALKSGVLQKYL